MWSVGVRADGSFSTSLDLVVGSWCWLSLEVTEKKYRLRGLIIPPFVWYRAAKKKGITDVTSPLA